MMHRTLALAGQALALALCLAASNTAWAQTKPDSATTADDDFSAYGDADAPATSYCTQKVLYLTPTRLFSFGYEAQGPFALKTTREAANDADVSQTTDVSSLRGFRFQTNTPVISRNNIILNVGLSYWNSTFDMAAAPAAGDDDLTGRLRSRGLRTGGLQATLFKPLNNKHFIIAQAQADVSGNYLGFNELTGQQLTYSGTAIYGWKPSDNLMYGFGLTRTYRAGQVLHIPVILFNRTFNPRWGIEAIVPARAAVRYNFSPSSMLLAGYEIEGNAFYLPGAGAGPDLWLRRGELKPRIGYEQKLAGFVWLAVQAGVRYNWRFAAFDTQNGGDKDLKDNQGRIFNTDMGLPFYANVSLNLVSP